MKKRIISILLTFVLLLNLSPLYMLEVDAAASLSANPYPKVNYEYTNETPVGTIRYIAQNRESEYFSWNYWPTSSFGSYDSPESECGTACISMALSYVGINRTPKALLEATNGVTGNMWGQQGTATSRAISKSTSAIASAMDDYIYGNGKYSPLCVYIVPFSATSSMHWVLLVGKIGENEYLALNPWHTSGTNGTFNIKINGTTATYHGVTNPISSVNQWYNPDATSTQKYTVTYHPNGGTCSTTTASVEKGKTIGTMPTPTLSGYEFIGWYTSPYGGSKVTSSTVATADMTLYARWQRNTDKIYFSNVHTQYDPVVVESLDRVNEPRGGAELVVYNQNASSSWTNEYGTEIAVNSRGKVVAYRAYGEAERLSIPSGGFILSGQCAWDSSTNYGGYTVVNEINALEEAYVSVDYATGIIKAYDSYDAYLANESYATDNATYKELPVPTREDCLFEGWFSRDGVRAVYGESVHSTDLYASWLTGSLGGNVATISYDDHTYELFDSPMSWEDAKEFCEDRGGHLVSITSQGEQNAVFNLIQQGDYGVYYMGCTDEEQEGTWKWITGESFSYNNWDPDYPEPDGAATLNYGLLVNKTNPPNKEPGEWMSTANKYRGGFYDASNTGFICEYETPKSVTISFVDYIGDGSLGSYAVEDGTVFQIPTTVPTYFGLTFLYWAIDGDPEKGIVYPGETFSPREDINFIAYWDNAPVITNDAASYSVNINFPNQEYWYRFNPSYSYEQNMIFNSFGETDSRIYLYDENGTLVAQDDDSGVDNNFRLNHLFVDGSDKTFYVKVRMYAGNTGYIPFEVYRGYEVFYDANGGSNAPLREPFLANADAVLSGTIPEREGYVFLGWSRDPEATAAEFSPGSVVTTNNSNLTVYAVWMDEDCYAGNHHYVRYVTEPTCMTNGYEEFSCSVCGDHYYGEQYPALGHDYSYAVSKKPTQTSTGTLQGTCSRCTETATVTLPKLNTTDYAYAVTVKPTTTQTGTGVYTWKETKYGEIAIYVTLDKLEATLSKIEVVNSPDKTGYYVGDTLNTSGLKLKATYSDGSTKTITSGFSCTPTKLETAGTQTITVTYEGKTTSFTVTVENVSVSSIAVVSNPTKTSYNAGETLDTSGLKVKVTYNNGSTETISSGFTCSPTKLETVGTQTITVTYGGKSATFTVTVNEAALVSISIASKPKKLNYIAGATLNTTGMTLEATYSDGSTKTITSGFSCTPTKLETPGYQTITVTYEGKTATYIVTVEKVSVSLISVATNPTKTTYVVGDTLDTTGLTIKVLYNDASTEIVSSGYKCTPTKLETAGTQVITVTYAYYSTNFTVTVNEAEATVNNISVASNPTKTAYVVGDTLDTTGLTLRVNYTDGSTETISSGFSCTPTKLETAGTQTITVTYGGKSTSFTVAVEEKAVDPDAPQIIVSNATAIVGKQVQVKISLANNPGIVSMMLNVGYDPAVLKLQSVTDAGQLGKAGHSDNYGRNPYVLSWENDLAKEDFVVDGEIVTLTFQVAENAPVGETAVTVSYTCDNYDIFNAAGENVWFATVNGSVNVIDVLLGDVNSDGKVNAEDRLVLTRYLAKWTDYPESVINMAAADVNCDGKVNAQDRLILARHLAAWTGYETLGA